MISTSILGNSLPITFALVSDLTGASNVYVNYVTPSGVQGYYLASISSPITAGNIFTTISGSTLTITGLWYFWGSAILSNGNMMASSGVAVEVILATQPPIPGNMYLSQSPVDFMYQRNFTFTDGGYSEISEAIVAISAQWSGVLNNFWSNQSYIQQIATRNLVYNLLIAWYLADMFSESLSGVVSNGGMPIVKKSLGGVDLTFVQYKIQEEMKVLTTNTFGLRALNMILSAPERFGIGGGSDGIWPMPTQGLPPVLL